MAEKNKGINWLVVIGIIALVLLIGKFKFAGILATTCENTEPRSIPEFQTVVANMSGVMTQVTPTISIQQNGSNIAFNQYDVKASFGNFQVFPTEGYPCNTVLAIVNTQLSNTSFAVIEERQVLLTPLGMMMCNYANNLMLVTQTTNEIVSYTKAFTACTSREVANVTSPYVQIESECTRLDGNWVNSTCMCNNGKQLELNHACPAKQTVTTPIPQANLTTASVETRQGMTTTDTLYIVGGIAVVLFTLYWLFERGPDKGLIRRK